MMRFLLDTNIISNIVSPRPSNALLNWLSDQADDTLFIASMTIAEIKRGILQLLPHGRRREQLEEWFDGADGPRTAFANRILAFDEEAALIWAALMAEGKRAGRPRDAIDMILAATAELHGCIVLTDNDRDFVGLTYFNPLRDADP